MAAYYAEPVSSFRSRKAAQICAFFALMNGGSIEKLKLIKLVYLSERTFLEYHDFPMLFDEFYSLENGPICSSTLNGINGIIPDDDCVWENYIARNGNIVVPVKKFDISDFDELSKAETIILDNVWGKLGHMTASQLRNYSHEHCPEYTEVEKGERLPISYGEVVVALGHTDNAVDLDERVKAVRKAESILSS